MAILMLDPSQASHAPPYPTHEEPQLREYLAVLRARKWGIVSITLVTVLAALFFSFRQTPIYESEAQVLVNPIQTSALAGILPPPPNLDTERTVAASLGVAQIVSREMPGAQDPEDLLGHLDVEVATNSEVLIIRYSDPGPLEAQRRTQAFAQAYLEFRQQRALETSRAVVESIEQQIQQVRSRLGNVNRQIAATRDPTVLANLQTQVSQLTARLAVLEQQKSEVVPTSQGSVGDIIAAATV